MIKYFSALGILLIVTSISFAQWDNINLKAGSYNFRTKYDSVNYETSLIVKKSSKNIYKKIFPGRIDEIKPYDLDGNGEKEYLINNYSGGAHCCNTLYAGRFISGKFKLIDSIYWGNSFYNVDDINKDGKFEIEGVNDIFAYAFTNYAESQFNILIYGFENNKFIDVTKNFPSLINDDIQQHMETLKPYTTDTSFACPPNDTTDTFNTDAGAVKAALAPIVADYQTLGEIQKGWDLVNSVYKCPDKDKFINTLKTDFKVK